MNLLRKILCQHIISTRTHKPAIIHANKVIHTYMKREMSCEGVLEAEPPKIGTHNGTFHCDDALACFMLKQLPEYKNAQIIRSRDNEKLHRECAIIVDVGGEFDHKRKLYDHHQKDFQETLSTLRPEFGDDNNIRLSSAGLIFVYYGERIINEILKRDANTIVSQDDMKLVFIQLYRHFISEIDAIDNGVPICPNGHEPLYNISTHVSARVSTLNLQWYEDDKTISNDDRFMDAMSLVGKEFVEKILNVGVSWLKAREYVREALKKAKDTYETGEILILEKHCPWKQHLFDLEKEYDMVGVVKLVLFQDESWRVAGVPIKPSSYLGRKFLPEPWRGLRNDDLCKVANLDDLIFVHHNGFIGGAKTKTAALAMAIKSVTWP